MFYSINSLFGLYFFIGRSAVANFFARDLDPQTVSLDHSLSHTNKNKDTQKREKAWTVKRDVFTKDCRECCYLRPDPENPGLFRAFGIADESTAHIEVTD